MKIGILHHDLEYCEKTMDTILRNDFGHESYLFDVREKNVEEIVGLELDFLLNRVYASVALVISDSHTFF